MGMKITQAWKRNKPSSVDGYSITYTITYSSMNEEEIIKQEGCLSKVLPMGAILISDTEGENQNGNKCRDQ